MNIRKFIAKTSRQALRDIRQELGDDAVIVSNRKVEDGVEIIAMLNEELASLHQPATHPAAHKPVSLQPVPSVPQPDAAILGEIRALQGMLQRQMSLLSENAATSRRDLEASSLLCKMLNAGFSAQFARQLIAKKPAGIAQGMPWITQVLKRNLKVADAAEDVVAKGGTYALIGPTGVGKTTTTAKLAGRAVVRYGADKVALLTTDNYRIGAFEQLKIYGKILGVDVHTVKDTEDLRLMLSMLRDKRLVLIDTMGMGQRDERVSEQSAMFDAVQVPRLLLLNAASSGDTMEDVVRMYHSDKVIGVIATKLDEMVTPGTFLDVVLRHRLTLHYMANGQCVPEDLHAVNVDYLLHRAFKAPPRKTPFAFDEMEFSALLPAVAAGVAQPKSSALI
jgi:flagellar biosynthesis protein FlhF